MSLFETVTMAPPDAILGLTEAFKKDSNPHKINLSVGVYKDENGETPIFNTVKKAEETLLRKEKSKSYLPIDGGPEYNQAVQTMVFGKGHECLTSNRVATAQTPGGTAALRVAADFLHTAFPAATIWISDPTWPNHPSVFKAAGMQVKTYPYFDAAGNTLDFPAMITALKAIPSKDVVLLHGCCHNPTGVDPTPDQWKQILAVIQERNLLPLVDFAYQGLADGLSEDAVGVRTLCVPGSELLVASSFSKNFGLYNERVGALSVVAADADGAARVLSQIKSTIRANYSNPPTHGGAIVSTILNDADLTREWESEVTAMRERINGMRELFVKTLRDKGIDRDFSFICRQRGMFSFSGLNKDQVERLKKEYGLYVVGSGRINVAGMTRNNMDRLCEAIAAVLK